MGDRGAHPSPPDVAAWRRCVRPNHGKGWAECGQDYQLHMSCYGGKSCQHIGLDLVMTRAENIPFLKEERRSLKKGNKRVRKQNAVG